MTKLVWMEFINTVFGKTKTQFGTSIATMLKTLLFLWMFMVASSDEAGNAMEFIILFSIGSFLETTVGDVIYMIPGKLEDYLHAKLKLVIGLQFGALVLIKLVRGVLHLMNGRQWILVEEISTFLGFCVFVVLRSVWKFYQKYTYQPFYQEKAAGVVAFFGLICCAISPSPGESDGVVGVIRAVLFLMYAGYTIHICLFVKKNIMLTTYFGGTE